MEEMRNKVSQAERNLKRAEDDKEGLENAQRDWKKRRDDLEQRCERCTRETEEVRSAMGELRDALDESERQARDLEKQKAELRRSVEETQVRLDKLQKTNKVGSIDSSVRVATDGLGCRPWRTSSALSKRPRPGLWTRKDHRPAHRSTQAHRSHA